MHVCLQYPWPSIPIAFNTHCQLTAATGDRQDDEDAQGVAGGSNAQVDATLEALAKQFEYVGYGI